MGEGFTSLSTVVTVPPNMESRSLVCVQVDITDDSILERDSESFTVALSHTDSAVRPSTAATLVQIVDDDCKSNVDAKLDAVKLIQRCLRALHHFPFPYLYLYSHLGEFQQCHVHSIQS